MPATTGSRRNRNKDNSPIDVPEVPIAYSPTGESVLDSKLQDVSIHLNTISSFLESTPNVPCSVLESFHALQSIISVPPRNCEDFLHRRSIVIQGIPELPLSTIPSVRQADVKPRSPKFSMHLASRPGLGPSSGWVGGQRRSHV